MKASIIIPLWDGEAVIGQCLDSLYTQPDEYLLEVICVDNASRDTSPMIVSQNYPQVRVLSQPVNLGFAGGVNVGLSAARGDFLILLNQDCLVYPGWLPALVKAFQEHPEFGLFGCTVYNPDGSLNHTGAYVRSPDAVGIHITEENDRLHPVEFATGAALGIRRETWQAVGPLDDDYYPAYYEDVDYCYRARSKGILTAVVPDAKVNHIFSSRTWESEPIWHTTNGYMGRYRFVSKHYNRHQIAEFFASEHEKLAQVDYLDHALGRMIAARHTERSLPAIIERRALELGEKLATADQRQLQVEFAYLAQQAFLTAEALVKKPSLETVPQEATLTPTEEFEQPASGAQPQLSSIPQGSIPSQDSELENRWADNYQRLLSHRQLEDQALVELRKTLQPDRSHQSVVEHSKAVFGNLKFLIYSDLRRLLELDGLQTQRMDDLHERLEITAHRAELYRLQLEQLAEQLAEQLEQRDELYRLQLERLAERLAERLEQRDELYRLQLERLAERVKLIELFLEHERE